MNVLVLGGRVIGYELARDLVTTFLGAAFTREDRHRQRLQKVEAIAGRYSGKAQFEEQTSYRPVITRDRYEAVLFDMDGVITDTASIHALAGRPPSMSFCRNGQVKMRSRFVPLMLSPITDFTSMESHDTRVSAISSHPAAFSCLRGLLRIPPLPKRCADSAIGRTNWLATRLASTGAEAYPGSVAFIMYMRRIGIKTAVVTSSENCQAVLRAAKVEDLFDGCVDGKTLVEISACR